MRSRVLLWFAMSAAAFAHPPADLPARLEAWVNDKPGGIAAAWVDADGVAFFNAGKFSAADPRAVTSDTPFEIGSLTKVFTALLLAETERAGKVSRDDPAAKYLLPATDPDQAKLAAVTLFALATHTSGLPRLPSDFPKLSTIFGHDPYAKLTREDLVASLRRDGPRAKTNAGYDYSNFGVALLGEALAAAWGTSYDEALRAHVLTPLGLQHTTLALAGRDAPKDLAPPHHSAKPVPRWTFATYAPCGALNSPARDLAKFLQAALAGANGKDAPLREAFAVTTKPQHAFPGGTIGLGWHLTDAAKPPVITWHNGGTAGSRCFLGFDANRGTGLVVLTNHDVAVDALAVALLRAAPPPAKPR